MIRNAAAALSYPVKGGRFKKLMPTYFVLLYLL